MKQLTSLCIILCLLCVCCKQYRPGTTENLIYRHLKGDLAVEIRPDSLYYRMYVTDKNGKDLSNKFMVSSAYIHAHNGNRGVGVIGFFTNKQLNYAGYDTTAMPICIDFNYYTITSSKQLRKPSKHDTFKVRHNGLQTFKSPHVKVMNKNLCFSPCD